MDDADVVIVGGGIAGLTAARELRWAGYRCCIVEARERLGGRVLTRRHFGRPRDVGATYVHWFQPHVWAEVARYQLQVTRSRAFPDRTVTIVGDHRAEGDSAAVWSLIGKGMEEFCRDAQELFPQPYGAKTLGDGVARVATQTIAQRIAELDVSDDARATIETFWAINCNHSVSEAALSHALHWVAACGSWKLFAQACSDYKLADGLTALVNALHADAQAVLILGDPVTDVEHADSRVVIRTRSGRSMSARACVIALPLNVVISSDLMLPFDHGRLHPFRAGAPRGGFKLWATTDRPLDASYVCMGPSDAGLVFARTEDTLPSSTVLGLYGLDRTSIDVTTPGAVESEIRKWIPNARIAQVWCHDWSEDPYSRETWRIARPGQTVAEHDQVLARDHRTVLAGADFAAGAWNGFVDGAVESGLNAARELRSALDSGAI